MYSKNDYRYYLENQLIHSNDFLAHYGIKGMKWKNKKKMISDIISDTGDKTNDIYNTAKSSAVNTSKKVKKKVKKAYKYADDHVDGYAYSSKKNDKSFRTRKVGAGVVVKTKKSDTSLGVYGKTTDIKTKKGHKIPVSGDVGIESGRNNKKKRKVTYISSGTGLVGPIPVYRYGRKSYKY